MGIAVVAILIALFFAINIGASGAAATMGVSYGSGAIKRKRIALFIVAVGVFLGAFLGGGEVVKTIGEGIIPEGILSIHIVVIILFASTVTLFGANLLGVPLSTSEVTVGSVVGVGVAYQALYVNNILVIVSFWLFIPISAFLISWTIGYGISWLEKRNFHNGRSWWRKGLLFAVVSTGFLEAFAAGMNNVANAVGPLVGAGVMSVKQGVFWGGLFIALGALILGGKVLETNGKKITTLSPLQGTAISGIGGTLVMIASIFGIPVPLTQVTTTAILGIGTAEHGFRLLQKNIIVQILKVWLVSPVLSLVVSFMLVKIFMDPDPFLLIAMLGVFVATIGMFSLYYSIRREKRTVKEAE